MRRAMFGIAQDEIPIHQPAQPFVPTAILVDEALSMNNYVGVDVAAGHQTLAVKRRPQDMCPISEIDVGHECAVNEICGRVCCQGIDCGGQEAGVPDIVAVEIRDQRPARSRMP